MATDNTFWQARIDALKERIVILEDAAARLEAGAIETYRLDTGQSVVTVTKSNMRMIESLIEALLSRLAAYEARLGCGGTRTAIPGF